jgi:hypothetical protein
MSLKIVRFSYKWRKDGIPFPLEIYRHKIQQKSNEGTFTITHLTADDQGVYECLAINDNGTAVSEKINFQAAFIQLFEEQPIEIVKVEIGDPYAHNCSSPPSNPQSRLFWILMVLKVLKNTT